MLGGRRAKNRLERGAVLRADPCPSRATPSSGTATAGGHGSGSSATSRAAQKNALRRRGRDLQRAWLGSGCPEPAHSIAAGVASRNRLFGGFSASPCPPVALSTRHGLPAIGGKDRTGVSLRQSAAVEGLTQGLAQPLPKPCGVPLSPRAAMARGAVMAPASAWRRISPTSPRAAPLPPAATVAEVAQSRLRRRLLAAGTARATTDSGNRGAR